MQTCDRVLMAHRGSAHLLPHCCLLKALAQQVCKEGWSVVHAHLLVVEGQAEQEATPAVMASRNSSSSTCLSAYQLGHQHGTKTSSELATALFIAAGFALPQQHLPVSIPAFVM